MKIDNYLKLPKNNICFDLNGMNLNGYWGQDIVNFIEIKLSTCINRTNSNVTCKSYEEIIAKIKSNIFVSLYTNNYYMMSSDHNNPLKVVSSLSYYRILNNIGKFYRFYYKERKIDQDMGIIFEQINSYQVLGIDSIESDIFTIESINNQTNFLIIDFFPSKNTETFKVRYIKVQEAFANIGGILNLITLVFSNIAIIVTKYERNLDIINKIFDFNGFENKERLNEIIKGQLIEIKRRDKIKIIKNSSKPLIVLEFSMKII
jgi:hypothetical protein